MRVVNPPAEDQYYYANATTLAGGFGNVVSVRICLVVASTNEVMDAPNGLEALRHVMGYILQVHDHKASVIAAVVERAAGPEAKEAIMTEGERLIQQGVQQGVQQGIQQGVQQGQRDLLLLVLKGRFGTAVDAEAELRLATASAEQLARWALRFHAAASLSELFAG